MPLIDATLGWVKGEVLEASIFGGFGILLCLGAFVCYRYAGSVHLKALFLLFLVVGLIIGGTGIFNAYSYKSKIKAYQQQYKSDPMQFKKAEKERVEGFQWLYTFTKYLAVFLFTAALLLLFFTNNPHYHATALALVVMGLTGLTIDYFSKARADVYYQYIAESS